MIKVAIANTFNCFNVYLNIKIYPRRSNKILPKTNSFSPGVFKFLFKTCSLTQNRLDQKSIFSNIPDFYYLVFNKVLARDWFSIICFFSPDKTKGTTNVTHLLIFELIELWYECENEEGLQGWDIFDQYDDKRSQWEIKFHIIAGSNTANWGATRSICWYFYLWGINMSYILLYTFITPYMYTHLLFYKSVRM